MIKIDLITGFLGSGKTTFIRNYVGYLTGRGLRVGIIENDFGAINVDMLMLEDLEGDLCDVEPIVGGNVVSDWMRRFKAKLIAMAMQGFDRVLVEPSGLYDADAFFDVIREDPVNRWFEPGSVLAIVDAGLEENLSRQEEYFLVSQIAAAGRVIFSKTQDVGPEKMAATAAHINRMMEAFHCGRRFAFKKEDTEENTGNPADVIAAAPWEDWTAADYEEITACGYCQADHEKLWFDKNDVYTSLFFLHVALGARELQAAAAAIFDDPACGRVFRIKGFLETADGWIALNATREHQTLGPVPMGQAVVIVIGQGLCREAIGRYLPDRGYGGEQRKEETPAAEK